MLHPSPGLYGGGSSNQCTEYVNTLRWQDWQSSECVPLHKVLSVGAGLELIIDAMGSSYGYSRCMGL